MTHVPTTLTDAANALAQQTGQSVIVENKPGATGLLAFRDIKESAPDAYTVTAGSPIVVGPIFRKDPGIDPERDFTNLAGMYRTDFVLVAPTSQPATLEGIINESKKNSAGLNFSAGATMMRLMGILLRERSGGNWEMVSYRGNGPGLLAALANEVQLHIDQYSSVRNFVNEGKLRILATTAEKRLSYLPDVPTFSELGYPELSYSTVAVISGPANMPLDVQQAAHAAFKKANMSPEVIARYRSDFLEPDNSSLEELKENLRKQIQYWEKAARVANYRPE